MNNFIESASNKRPAVVLSCAGAPHGDLNLVRSLGAYGVGSIVVGEDPNPPARFSKYCIGYIHLRGFPSDPHRLHETLEALCQKWGVALPVLPSADPDLAALNELQQTPGRTWLSPLASPALVRALMDKQLFDQLARSAGLPVPLSFAPRTLDEAIAIAEQLVYPAIIKPAQPNAWRHPQVPREIGSARAFIVGTATELIELCRKLAPCGIGSMIQEYIPGTDDANYEVHAYVDHAGRVAATYCGRKWHLYPPRVGTGCLVETLHEPGLEALAADILKRIDFRGLCNIDFKRHSITGEYKLMEINGRVSHWHILASRAGVNLPWIAYRDLCGLPLEPLPTRQVGLWYRHAGQDIRTMRSYYAAGQLSLPAALASLFKRRVVYQVMDWSDLGPFVQEGRKLLNRLWNRLTARRTPGD